MLTLSSSQILSPSPPFLSKSLPAPLHYSTGSCSYSPPMMRRSSSSSRRCRAAGKEESESSAVEFDRQKAREALEKLDQQLQSLARDDALPSRRPPPSYDSYPELNLDRDQITGMTSTEEMPEISGSFLAYTAVALLILTVFNNIAFNVFIKPSIDGKEVSTKIERVPLTEPEVRQLPQQQ